VLRARGVAVGSAVVAWGALSNLWADYQDSPTATDVLFGGAFAILSAAALAALGLLLGRRS
jgi:hypothetical protein